MSEYYIPSLEILIEQFEQFPGIGRKTAQRMAYYILDMSESDVLDFSKSIVKSKKKIKYCNICYNLTDKETCSICSDISRDRTIICVVSESKDVFAFERTKEFNGLYHVLHGEISPMNGISPEDIKIKELLKRLSDGQVKELIMSTSPTVEGEATAMYISRIVKTCGVKTSRLAYGIPVGSDLEYADEITLSRAIKGRNEIN